MRNFLDTMAENNRLSQLPEVCQKFLKLTSAAKGEVEVIVTSAAVCSLGPNAVKRDERPELVKIELTDIWETCSRWIIGLLFDWRAQQANHR